VVHERSLEHSDCGGNIKGVLLRILNRRAISRSAMVPRVFKVSAMSLCHYDIMLSFIL